MPVKKMSDCSLEGKKVLIREDFNVPLKNNVIGSEYRIKAAIPTIQQALAAGGKVMLASHLGRPYANSYEDNFSLAPIAKRLSHYLHMPVPLIKNWIDGFDMGDFSVVLLENVRFHSGETNNSTELSAKMAALCDVFVMDAFATAHRSEASTLGIMRYTKQACAGPLLLSELAALEKVTKSPEHPIVAIVGGSKVSTKMGLLDSLIKKVDYLIVGGGIANTFLASKGYAVGKSLYEADLIDEAERLTLLAQKNNVEIPMLIDVVVSEKLSGHENHIKLVSQIDDHERILDIGPDTTKVFVDIIQKAKTILWNGPIGTFEVNEFSTGTKEVAKAIAKSKAFKIAGGGDTLVAIEKYNISDDIDYISTGGGAFLTVLEGKKLPVMAALEEYYEKNEKVT